MSRKSRRAVAIAIAGVLTVAPMVSGCAAGQHPESALPTQLVEGVNASVHQVGIRNLFVLGPEPGRRLPAHGSAPVYASIVNDAPAADRLVAVEAPGTARSVEIAGGSLQLPPGTLISTNTPAPSAPAPSAPATAKPVGPAPGGAASSPSTLMLKDLLKDLNGTETIQLAFRFERAGSITVNVPVEPRQGTYLTYSPAPTAVATSPAAGTATPTPGSTRTGKPGKPGKSKKASPTPSA